MKLRYAPRAKADIADIHAYIADRNAKAATAVISRLKAAAELMEKALRPLYHELHAIREDLEDLRHRVKDMAGYRKEIDYAFERIAAIEKHLGIDRKHLDQSP